MGTWKVRSAWCRAGRRDGGARVGSVVEDQHVDSRTGIRRPVVRTRTATLSSRSRRRLGSRRGGGRRSGKVWAGMTRPTGARNCGAHTHLDEPIRAPRHPSQGSRLLELVGVSNSRQVVLSRPPRRAAPRLGWVGGGAPSEAGRHTSRCPRPAGRGQVAQAFGGCRFAPSDSAGVRAAGPTPGLPLEPAGGRPTNSGGY